jgi:iron complex outermembrane receptor protein
MGRKPGIIVGSSTVASRQGVFCVLAAALLAAPAAATARDLAALSLEDLLAQEVTSTAKRPQNVQEAPAAVFVIDREDIRRSGAADLPGLLRMVPGVEVAQLSGGRSAVSVRGFNGPTSNKLLVLVDGREVYVPGLPGVPWDQQLVPVEDIERIEVVRGPGAALWGANAVNGVINVVTKHAADSLGGAMTVEADSRESGRVYLRQGFRIGESGALRVYGTGRRADRDSAYQGIAINDEARAWQAGARFDMDPSERDSITLQGDVQRGRYAPVPLDTSFEGAPSGVGHFTGRNILGRWTRTNAAGRTTVQAYYDDLHRLENANEPIGQHLFNAEVSNQVRLGARHDVVWGLTYRRTEGRFADRSRLIVLRRVRQNYGGYVQDDVTLAPDRLLLSLGAKVEHHPVTGVEFQPSVRMIWTDPNGWSLWAAASRAKRTPAARETDVSVDLRPIPAMLVGGPVDPETLTAYEAGWRGPLGENLTLDATAYYNRYSDLIAYRTTYELIGGDLIAVAMPGNVANARAYGVEAELDFRARPWWTLKAAASWQHIRVGAVPGDTYVLGSLAGERSPQGQVSLRSMMDLSDSVDLDTWIRRVGRLGDGATPAYTEVDLRLAWRPKPGLELQVRGENLLGHESPQMRTDLGVALVSPSVRADRRLSVAAALRY